MKINTEGLVVSEQAVGEYDKLITVLTKKEGLIRAFVRSARNVKNKNSIGSQMLCYSDFLIYKGRDKYIITETVPQNLFFDLRNDIEKLALSQYFCELAILLVPQGEFSDEPLRLLLNSFYYLINKTIPAKILKSIVEIKMISIAGFMPDLVCCKKCGNYISDSMYFSLKNGNLVCSDCFKNHKDSTAILLNKGAVAAFRHIIYSEFNKIFFFELDPRSQELLSITAEKYLLEKTEHNFKTLNFYKTLLLSYDVN